MQAVVLNVVHGHYHPMCDGTLGHEKSEARCTECEQHDQQQAGHASRALDQTIVPTERRFSLATASASLMAPRLDEAVDGGSRIEVEKTFAEACSHRIARGCDAGVMNTAMFNGEVRIASLNGQHLPKHALPTSGSV